MDLFPESSTQAHMSTLTLPHLTDRIEEPLNSPPTPQGALVSDTPPPPLLKCPPFLGSLTEFLVIAQIEDDKIEGKVQGLTKLPF